jgi:PleD family two-component response regulator
MSCGVAATAPGEPFDFDAVFARADAALYEAKRSGRNCVRVGAAPAELVAA